MGQTLAKINTSQNKMAASMSSGGNTENNHIDEIEHLSSSSVSSLKDDDVKVSRYMRSHWSFIKWNTLLDDKPQPQGETFFICWITLPADLKNQDLKKKMVWRQIGEKFPNTGIPLFPWKMLCC